jgi:hypothetical protein
MARTKTGGSKTPDLPAILAAISEFIDIPQAVYEDEREQRGLLNDRSHVLIGVLGNPSNADAIVEALGSLASQYPVTYRVYEPAGDLADGCRS